MNELAPTGDRGTGRALALIVAVGATAVVAAWTALTSGAAAAAGHGGADAPYWAVAGVVAVAVGLVMRSEVLTLPIGFGAILVAAARTPDVARAALLEGPIGIAWASALALALALVLGASVQRDRPVASPTSAIPPSPSPAPRGMHAARGFAGLALFVVPLGVVVARRGLGHASPDVASLVFALLLLVFSAVIGFYSAVATPALNARWDALRLDRAARGRGRAHAFARLAIAAVFAAVAFALLL